MEEDEQSITHTCMPSILYSNRLKEAGRPTFNYSCSIHLKREGVSNRLHVQLTIWESFRDLACIIEKHNKSALRLKCYNFRRVHAIVFLFSALHITPFLYGKILFGILHLLLASIATFDTPPGSNPP